MSLKDLDFYEGVTRESIQDNAERDKIYQKIHEASVSYFENPDELKELEWIKERKFVTTAPADALNAAVRTFASRIPRPSIQPLSDAPEEYDRVEKLEEAMMWEFRRMNSIGKKSPHWKIVEYAMKYCAVAVETSYLPWVYQGKTDDPRIQAILRGRHFKWNVHDPSNVYARESDDVLEMISTVQVKSLQELIEMFGKSNTGIQKLLEGKTMSYKDLVSNYYTLYDYTDWDARVKWVVPNGSSKLINKNPGIGKGVELMRKKRKVSFLPWVFVDNEEPLLKQMVLSEMWENVNILRTMTFSKAVDMAAHPEYWIATPDGSLRGVNIDGQNPNQPLVTTTAARVQKLQPPSIDPNLTNMTVQAEQEVFRTTVAQILASVEKYAGTQNFSVVNAMLNAAIAQLSLSQMVAERAETEAMKQNLAWIQETDIPMTAFREKAKGETKKVGEELQVRKGDYDLQYLALQMNLSPTTVMDEQTQINNAINKVERLGMSLKMAWDELGIENFELSESQKTEESLYQAFIGAAAQKIMTQMSQPPQQQPNPENAAGQSQFSGAQGMTGAQVRPGQGREQLNGQSASGQEIA